MLATKKVPRSRDVVAQPWLCHLQNSPAAGQPPLAPCQPVQKSLASNPFVLGWYENNEELAYFNCL